MKLLWTSSSAFLALLLYSYHHIKTITLNTWILSLLWFIGWRIFVYAEFGSVWIIASLIAAIFFNLGDRKRGELSAYSVFNENFQHILGTLTADQIDAEIRHQ
jgi:hypothetical protein